MPYTNSGEIATLNILLEGCSDTEKNEQKRFNPVSGIGMEFEGRFELAVKLFDETVCNWMVCSSTDTLKWILAVAPVVSRV